jgi:carboxypeptidase C (cathepsin A)
MDVLDGGAVGNSFLNKNRFYLPLLLILAASLSAYAAEPQSRPARGEDRGKPETRPDAKPEAKAPAAGGDKLSFTDHEVKIGGTTIKYRATAGTYQLKDEAGKAKADLFFVAYEKTPLPEGAAEIAKRPITFVFNGGPGAAAVWLHLGTAGPRRVKLTENGEATPPPYATVENEFSWRCHRHGLH